MATPHWKQLGFLTPDAPGCQQDVWGLQALLRLRLGDALAMLAQATAEPTWGDALGQESRRAAELAGELDELAGEPGRVAVADDELVRDLDGALCEVVASGHVPSLLATGYAVLGELAVVPVALLDDVAGTHVKLTTARVLTAEHHRILGRLIGIVQLGPTERSQLRRLLRHLHELLATVHLGWRQTFHTLGVDGERLTESSRHSARQSLEHLGLKPTRADLAVFRDA